MIDAPDASDALRLRVPADMSVYLVYRRRMVEPESHELDGFMLLSSPFMPLRCWRAMLSAWRARATLKTVAKLASGRRQLFCVIRDGRLVAYGWMNHGFCRKYDIERDACAIGPIFVSPEWRGKGLIAAALTAAMCTTAAQGRRLFYIDAHLSNSPSHSAIRKAGFEGPIAAVPHVSDATR